MMNDALMQMKSRNNYTKTYQTGIVRRALILFNLLLCLCGNVWGQVTFVGSGVIDDGHVSDYYTIVNNYTVQVPITDVTSWTGDDLMPSNQGEHWNGTNDPYADRWYGSAWTQTDFYRTTSMNLPEGSYVILAPGRASDGVTLSMKVDNNEVQMGGRGNTGLGITTSGVASFNTYDSYANDNNGRGWQYFYIKFDVGSSGADVVFTLSGSSNAGNKWMSFTTPKLLKAVVDNVNSIELHPSSSSIYVNSFADEKTTDGSYIVQGGLFPSKADCRFIRFYLVDAVTNNPVAIPNLTSSQGTAFHNYGTLGMATTSNSAFLDNNNFTLTLPNVRGQYKLFCFLSNAVGTQEIVGGVIRDVEPTITSAYEMDIAYPFPGSLRSGSIQTIDIPVNTGEKLHNVTELYADYNVISTGLSSQGRALSDIQMHTWSDWGAGATSTGDVTAEYVLNSSTNVAYGDPGVNNYVDLVDYATLVVTVANGTPRFLFNRTESDGQCDADESQSKLIEYPNYEWCNRYFTKNGNVYTVNLQKIKADKGFVHLHAIKGANYQNVTVESMKLFGTPLTDNMMHSWSGYGAGSSQTGEGSYSYVLGSSTTQPFGDANVIDYADLSEYDKLVITMTSGTPRFLFNRTEEGGQCNADESQSKLIEYPNYEWCNRYFTKDGNTYIVDLEKMRNEKGFVHLHAIKGANWQSVNVDRMELYKNSYTTGNIYACLFVADKNTGEQLADQNALNITPSSGWTKRTNDPQNWVYYGSASGLKDALNNINVSSSNPLYQGNATVSLVISSNLTRLAPASPSSVDAIITEPNWEKQYLLDFYKTDNYIASLQTGGTEIRSAIPLESADVTSRLITELPQFNISSGKVYARLFVADDAGETVDNQTLISFGDLSSKGWTWREHYGWVYYGDGFSESQLQNITVSASTALAATGAIIGLAITTSDMSRLGPSGVTSAADITEEPNWEYLYLSHFTYPFAGTVKSNYFRHSKEVLLTSSEVSAGVTQIPLNEALSKIKSEYVKTNETLAQNFHIRWFVTYKGEMIANSEDYLAPVTSGTEHKTKDGYGIYWNSATCPTYPLSAGSESTSSQTINWLNMNFTKPDYGHWSDYKVVVWLSDDTSASNGQTTSTDGSGTILTHEPDINMVYYYSFFVEEDFRFVHSKGAAIEAYPDLQYLIKSSSVHQYDWDNTTSTQVPANGDIRQDVHTVIYDVYLDPNGGLQPLQLPFENYFTTGNDLEPTAYIRWYDWETDLGSDKLTIVGTWLENLRDFDTGNSRGFFALNRDLTKKKPTHNMVGVTYNPSGLTSEHVIACDVSKYFDGTYRGSNPDTRPDFSGLYHPYMLHEPTLSIRYLFRIHPAKDIVKKINDGKSDFDTQMATIKSTADGANYRNLSIDQKKEMFELCEDNGLVAVSYKDGSSQFALRANLASLNQYYVGTESNPVQCDKIYWFSYYEDADGLLYEKQLNWGSDNRINLFAVNDLIGTYHVVSSGWTEKTITLKAGMKFHVVGRIGTGVDDYQPVVHYELQFNNAPALLVDDLSSLESDAQIGKDVLHRRKAYLDSHYNYAGRVSFDEFFSTNTLNNQNENHTEKPLPWPEAQYAYCYPQIDQYRIATGVSGLTPIHGDYILLKSAGGTYSHHMDNSQPYQYFFYRDAWGAGQTEMHDFTRMYGDGTYGGFLYVDASNEARTIASLDFNAKLCSGSQIFFTAAISDITTGENGSIAPQLMIHVYGVDGSGNKTEKPIVSFLSGSLRSVAYGSSFQYCKWYQLYGRATIPSSIDVSGYTTFAADIDNYSEHTNGADFCVDEIRFYTSTGKVTVNMENGTCVDESMTFSANMDVEHLESKMVLTGAEQTIYYRIYKKTGKDAYGNIQSIPYPDTSIYGNSGKSYGQVTIYKYILDSSGNLTSSEHNNGYYIDPKDGQLYFNLLENKTINLEQGNEYYIALTKDLNSTTPPGDAANQWANPNDACDVYSNFFVPRKTYIRFLDQYNVVSSQTIQGDCSDLAAANVSYTVEISVPDDDEPTGFKVVPTGTTGSLSSTGPLFDFFKGTAAELNAQHSDHGNKTLLQALRAYRKFERDQDFITAYSTDGQPNSGYSGWGGDDATKQETADYYAILDEAVRAGKLFMSASSTFDNTITETSSFLAIPVQDDSYAYTVDEKIYYLCDYFPFTFIVNGGFGTPELALGFDDVKEPHPYPDNYKNVIRVGLEQLSKMKNDGYKLHVPVRMFKDKNKGTSKKVYFPTDSYFEISKLSSDPAGPAIGTKFAKIIGLTPNERPYVNKTRMYLPLDLSECAIDFHEGYEYEVSTSFLDEDDADATNPCMGDLYIVIKVVPEFVTWEAQPIAGETGYWSANWYNDDNWKRSTRAELYKGAKGGSQNTATAGHPNGYDNNGEGSLSGLTTGSNPGFVPMKFTHVILPSGNNAPSLINEPKLSGEGIGSARQGGGFLDFSKTELQTDYSPNGNIDGQPKTQSSLPTENIYFDMMVRYSIKENDPYGEGCFGHRILDDEGKWVNDSFDDSQGPVGEVFDCEKFYGNVCKEIYFKPGSELLRQHRLEYQKAWVEMELDANKWYLVSTPLKNSYAGDMYVPFANGRQETEAFQPITFNTTNYSRTKYPIYQRSWGMNNGNVYVKQNDIRANSYSANLKYNTESLSILDWGHAYNDVQVPYTTITGYSIRAHKKNQTGEALIRLPKADVSYDYYDWNENTSNPAAGTDVKTVVKSNITISNGLVLPPFTVNSANRFVTDDQTNDGVLTFNISNMQQQGDYILVGNPYMVSIDMEKFFTTNSSLEAGYWTYEGNVASAELTNGLIKPMQAFFVKKGTATTITFNRQMQIDGNFPTPPASGGSGSGARQMTMTLNAANSRGSSLASVELNEKASAGYVGGEDVETLFDSNLADVPMVYTVAADGKAVSINQLPALEVVPFGVSCSGDEMIDVTVDHSVYVFDALLGTTTAVNEGESVSIQPNDYGRYYLTVSEDASGLLTNKAVAGITISVRDRVVTVTSNDDINQVKAVNVSGVTAYESTVGSKTTQFTLPTGTYIIDVNGVAGNKTVKILVK